MTINNLKILIKSLVEEAKLNTKKVYVYHISDNANLHEPLEGVYSGKFRQQGLFTAPLSAIKRSWASWASGKGRFSSSHGEKEESKRENQTYKELTLYKLAMPKWVLDQAKAQHSARAEESMKANPDTAFGAWSWDLETFIPKDLLQHVHIAGRKTGNWGEFFQQAGETEKHRKGQKVSFETQHSIGPEGELKKTVARFGDEPASLEIILKAKDESLKLLNKEELENVVDKLEEFLSANEQNASYDKKPKTYYEQEQEKARLKRKETAERKLSIARKLIEH